MAGKEGEEVKETTISFTVNEHEFDAGVKFLLDKLVEDKTLGRNISHADALSQLLVRFVFNAADDLWGHDRVMNMYEKGLYEHRDRVRAHTSDEENDLQL